MARLVTVEFDGGMERTWYTKAEIEEFEKKFITCEYSQGYFKAGVKRDDWDPPSEERKYYLKTAIGLWDDFRALAPFKVVKFWEEPRIDEFVARQNTVINQKVNVAVPGFGLMSITEVTNCNDMCTDALQEMMKEGWKILAICVQPDQRRPDYILGRFQSGSIDA